ncbi:single-stranded DNA-binding protein [Patescibacteria group bacterium]|nr:single-stranded DNA-binding protein [Patescibacteria group bacterium]
MAYALNKVQIIGNLTRDPELRQTPNGNSVCGLGIATNSVWKDQNGEKQERAEFHNVVCWGKLAEIAGQYLKKGSKVYIEGRLQTRDWTGDDGVKRYRTEIVAENLIMLDSRGGEASSMDREAGGIKGDTEDSVEDFEDKSDSKAAVVKKEEEVTVDDLPF